MPVNKTKLGERIRYFREKANMSQETLAERVDKSREFINRVELGVYNPSIDTFIDIANALQVTADDLLDDSLEKTSQEADSEIRGLLVGCNRLEEQIIVKTIKELKSILYSLGI